MAVAHDDRRSAPPPGSGGGGELDRILQLEVPVIVRLARRRMPVGEVMKLAHGAILELHKHHEEPLHLMVNNKAVAEGEAVKVGEQFGLRLTAVGDLRDRLDAMRG